MSKLFNITLLFVIVMFVNGEVISQLNVQNGNGVTLSESVNSGSSNNGRVLNPALEELLRSYLETHYPQQSQQSKGQTNYDNTTMPPPPTNSTLDNLLNQYNYTNPYKGQTNYDNTTMPPPPNNTNTTLDNMLNQYNYTNPYKGQTNYDNTTAPPAPGSNSTLDGIFNQYNYTNPYKRQSSYSNIGSQFPTISGLTLQQLLMNYLSNPYHKGQTITQDATMTQEEAYVLVQLLKKSGLKIGTI